LFREYAQIAGGVGPATDTSNVTPAKAGVHNHRAWKHYLRRYLWIPAFAGTTFKGMTPAALTLL
jgi:hypothetical protein